MPVGSPLPPPALFPLFRHCFLHLPPWGLSFSYADGCLYKGKGWQGRLEVQVIEYQHMGKGTSLKELL